MSLYERSDLYDIICNFTYDYIHSNGGNRSRNIHWGIDVYRTVRGYNRVHLYNYVDYEEALIQKKKVKLLEDFV